MMGYLQWWATWLRTTRIQTWTRKKELWKSFNEKSLRIWNLRPRWGHVPQLFQKNCTKHRLPRKKFLGLANWSNFDWALIDSQGEQSEIWLVLTQLPLEYWFPSPWPKEFRCRQLCVIPLSSFDLTALYRSVMQIGKYSFFSTFTDMPHCKSDIESCWVM